MNILSLFDGLSCGQIALKELGVKVDKYYASEVDKFAIAQTKLNFPNTIHLGDVTKIDVSILPKIDILIGGSPCQNFSLSGKMNGMTTENGIEITTLEQYLDLKGKGFEFDGQSYLFWEYVRILKEVKPKYFLLENVVMTKKWERLINETLGMHPAEINSSLVSAQNRVRLYWSNIRVKEVGLFGEKHTDIPQPKDRNIYLKDILEEEVDDKYYLSDKMIKCFLNRPDGWADDFKPFDDFDNKARCLGTKQYRQGDNYINNNGIRRLTPTECARLQTIPDWYKWECSDTQQYKMLGNGWTIEVIKHIFKFL